MITHNLNSMEILYYNGYDITTVINMLPLNLKEKSDYFLGNCPFHNDKNPSFTIKKNTGFYKCYACGEKGSFSELVYKLTGKGLCKFLNIQSDVNEDNYSYTFKKNLNPFVFNSIDKKAKINTKELVVKGNLLSVYQNKKIMDYLNSREVNSDFIDFFKIQYCDYMEINTTKFYNRLVIPLYLNNQIVNYEGRDFTKKQKAKCLYIKEVTNDFLFNIDNLNFDEELIICEGLFDINKIWQHISKNVTYTFGCNINEQQKETIKKFKKIVLFIDNDKAGWKQVEVFESFYPYEFYIACSDTLSEDPGDLSIERTYKALNNKILSVDYFLKKSKLFENKEIIW